MDESRAVRERQDDVRFDSSVTIDPRGKTIYTLAASYCQRMFVSGRSELFIL